VAALSRSGVVSWLWKSCLAALFCVGSPSFAQTTDRCRAHAGYPPDPWAPVRFTGKNTNPLQLTDIYRIALSARERPGRRVCVVGLSDNFGGPTYDAPLAAARLRTVADTFLSRGLARDEVVVTMDRAVLRKLFVEGRLKLGSAVNDNELIILFVFSHDGERSS
jgi:hypothetical protein